MDSPRALPLDPLTPLLPQRLIHLASHDGVASVYQDGKQTNHPAKLPHPSTMLESDAYPLADRLCKSMKANPNCAQCNKTCKETMKELLKTARTTYVRFGPSHCFRWSDKFYDIQSKKDNKGCYTLKQVEGTYSVYRPFPETWRLGHSAVQITLCDGTVLYADDGWWGYFDSIFLVVPPYVYQTF